jgi:hypothetical protein
MHPPTSVSVLRVVDAATLNTKKNDHAIIFLSQFLAPTSRDANAPVDGSCVK